MLRSCSVLNILQCDRTKGTTHDRHMKYYPAIFATFLWLCFSNTTTGQTPIGLRYTLSVIESTGDVVINRDHPQVKDNKNGFEGGTAFRHGKDFHLFVTEEVTGWSQTRTGHWQSKDGQNWQRTGTLQAPAPGENDARYSIWSPMPVYNKNEKRWNLFYVGYETKGTIYGRVFRAVSEKKGKKGLAGPYKDQPGTVIAFTDPAKNDWEGVQGTDSFFPFRIGNKWLSFYGSSDARSYWYVGLAEADSLEGKWKRIWSPPVFTNAENPIVITLDDGTYFCVYDDLTHLSNDNRIGYAWSADGIRWQSSYVTVPLPQPVTNIRTPQSMIPAGNNTFWIYYTGNTTSKFDVVARIKVKLTVEQ